jgi:hypothetical protein
MTAESGLDHLPGVEEHFRSSTYIAEVMSIFLCAESCVADDNID